ncbi:MAG: N-acetyltransferase family protein [Bacteroidota bacterium]
MLRLARLGDLPAIVGILNQSAGTGANARLASVPVENRRAWFDAHTPSDFPLWVAEVERAVVGWCSLSRWRGGREALRGVAEISYYVDRAHHRQGIATALVRHAMDSAPDLGLHTLLAIGLETNPASEVLLRRGGFERWGLLPQIAEIGGKRTGQWIYGRRL